MINKITLFFYRVTTSIRVYVSINKKLYEVSCVARLVKKMYSEEKKMFYIFLKKFSKFGSAVQPAKANININTKLDFFKFEIFFFLPIFKSVSSKFKIFLKFLLPNSVLGFHTE